MSPRTPVPVARRCALALFALLLVTGCGERASQPPAAMGALAYDLEGRALVPLRPRADLPHVALLVLDAAPPESPAARALAEAAVAGLLFDAAGTASPERWPSLASLMTALLPDVHAVSPEGFAPAGYARAWTTPAEVLSGSLGYDTAALLTDEAPAGLDPLLQGVRHVERLAGSPAAAFDAWRAAHAGREAPWFVLAVLPAAADPARELAALEASLARERGDRTLLTIVTALRGTPLPERPALLDVLRERTLRVPLALGGWSGASGRRGAAVGLVDVLPTLLSWLGLPPLDDVQGTSFADLLETDGRGRACAFAWLGPGASGASERRRLWGARDEAFTYGVLHDLEAGTVTEHLLDHREGDLGADLVGPDGRPPAQAYAAALVSGVERARDRIWAGVASTHEMIGGGYESSARIVTTERPPPLVALPGGVR